MVVILGSEQCDKTTLLLQYIYENLEREEDSDSYAIILVSRSSKHFNDLIFGKYDSVAKNVLDRIHIKYIEKYEELIKFFDDLLFISKENLPLFISIDRINLFFNIFMKSQKKENYIYNLFIKLQSVLERLSLFAGDIGLIFSFDIEVDFVEPIDIYEELIFDILNIYCNDEILYVYTNSDKLITIYRLLSCLDISSMNFKKMFKLSDLSNCVPRLREHFMSVQRKLNEYYKDLNKQ